MPQLPTIVGLKPTADPIEEIIGYVMHTPENINANILREMLIKLGQPITDPDNIHE